MLRASEAEHQGYREAQEEDRVEGRDESIELPKGKGFLALQNF
jgi:hypothetical protein